MIKKIRYYKVIRYVYHRLRFITTEIVLFRLSLLYYSKINLHLLFMYSVSNLWRRLKVSRIIFILPTTVRRHWQFFYSSLAFVNEMNKRIVNQNYLVIKINLLDCYWLINTIKEHRSNFFVSSNKMYYYF